MQQTETNPLSETKLNEYRPEKKPRKPLRPSPCHQFDFEVGDLVRSPCIGCPTRPYFPKCIDQCDRLDRIHTVLAGTISCTRRR